MTNVVTRADYSSCFHTTDVQLAADGHKFVLTVKLDKRASINGLTLVQDTRGSNSNTYSDSALFFHDWTTRIGDNSDHMKNPICPGGPFMTTDAYNASTESGYVYDQT